MRAKDDSDCRNPKMPFVQNLGGSSESGLRIVESSLDIRFSALGAGLDLGGNGAVILPA